MPGPITKEQVKKIIKKLHAVDVTTKNDVHDMWAIWHNGRIVGTMGVRRSPVRDIPHPHIPGQLGVNEHFVRGLANCPKSMDDWLTEIGEIIPETDDESEPG
jgi:hypothetical protein